MKLTSKKKNIILFFLFNFLLMLTLAITIFLYNPTSNASSNLINIRNQNIFQIETKINSKGIKAEELLSQIVNEKFNSGETDWRDYLKNSITIKELNTRKQNLLNIIENLPTKLTLDEWKNKGEINFEQWDELRIIVNTNELYTLYQLLLLITPKNTVSDWNKILLDIKEFMKTKPKTLAEVRDWARVKLTEVGNPMRNANLAGADKFTLRLLPSDDSFASELSGSKDVDLETTIKGKKITKHYGANAERWRSYTGLSTIGDGNCFLNSLSIMLEGKNDGKWAVRLRVRMCLDWMIDDNLTIGSDTEKLNSINYKLMENENHPLASNHAFMSGWDISEASRILSRPITLVYKSNGIKMVGSGNYFIANTQYDQPAQYHQFTYEEPWFIYHVESCHFITLIRPDNHEEGKIRLKAKNIETDSNSVLFNFETGKIKTIDFSKKNQNKISSMNFNQKTKLRILFNSLEEKQKWSDLVEEKLTEYTEEKKDGKIVRGQSLGFRTKRIYSINIIKAFDDRGPDYGIRVEDDEIKLNSDNYEEIDSLQ